MTITFRLSEVIRTKIKQDHLAAKGGTVDSQELYDYLIKVQRLLKRFEDGQGPSDYLDAPMIYRVGGGE